MVPSKKDKGTEKVTKYWILSGDTVNWEKGIKDGIWGCREGLKRVWDKLNKGDVLIFYVQSPISGIIGFGRASSKFKQDKPLWQDEILAGKVLYPYRFEFNIDYCLPKDLWMKKAISIRELRLSFRAGVNPVANMQGLDKLKESVNKKWNVNMAAEGVSSIASKKRKEYPQSLHNMIKEFLYEMGKIENYISEKEYPLDGERLDVAWRRVERGVPSRVFEVQIGGDIYHALGKLKHAYDLWNSDLYIVLKEKDRAKVEALLSGTFHEIANRITIVETEVIEKLHELQMGAEDMKSRFGLT